MSIQFQTSTDENSRETLVVAGSFGIRIIANGHAHFERIRDGLFDGSLTDEDELLRLLEPGHAIEAEFNRVSERVQYRHGNIYFDGDLIDKAITRHMLEKLNNGDPEWKNLVLFMEKLASNPNPDARRNLYRWVEHHGVVINSDGDMVGYKGVRNDGTSQHPGYGIVNGVEMNGHLPHEVGSVVEFPRSRVDESSTMCSVGLHVGTYEYAQGFAPRLLTVLVNPRDVVGGGALSDLSWKFRTCRYRVIELAPEAPYSGTSFHYDDDDESCDDCDEYTDDCYCDDETDANEYAGVADGTTLRITRDGFVTVAVWIEATGNFQLSHRTRDGRNRLDADEFAQWVEDAEVEWLA